MSGIGSSSSLSMISMSDTLLPFCSIRLSFVFADGTAFIFFGVSDLDPSLHAPREYEAGSRDAEKKKSANRTRF
jgi:hypothetical protein